LLLLEKQTNKPASNAEQFVIKLAPA